MPSELTGYHVTCDGLPPAPLWDGASVRAWMEDVIRLSGLTVIEGPNIYDDQGRGKIVGMAVIAESHIAFHGDTRSGSVFAECFSCQPVDIPAFVEATLRYFGISESGQAMWRRRGAA